ncbi:hypothetical protein [Pedobacter sp. Hv1]|uniref:hypothetical protein n=1 Tax=Pedobacter sp. Hv1 TaxID=1740090 RepID=UPI0006D8D1C6|nr:hypothetical protein [Pedobacter sp. Hv1]KQC02064.1 hypothetical protein AQF98_00380 [Pedobacter sp. Hv1]
MSKALTQQRIEDIEQNVASELIGRDDPEDCRRSLFFAIKEHEEIESGQSSFSDKLFDLRMRHCRFL